MNAYSCDGQNRDTQMYDNAMIMLYNIDCFVVKYIIYKHRFIY